MTAKPEAAIALAFKADAELREEIQSHLGWMHDQTPGVTFSQSDALRNLLALGLSVSREERARAKKNGGRKR